ncbi:MAG: zinc-dependent alcohol dehydrogenase family protein [Gammaproteobacteria bacterium]|nr:zinc-dependent alcohol dehydrogenase family protein [Gammaproteobacteria bacterium]
MQAVVMTATGAPDRLALREVPIPAIEQPNQVLIRVRAAGVNPIDTKLRRNGTFYPDRLPAILGCDGAGIVEAVGNDVSRFSPGDEVYYCYGGIGAGCGNYAEYTLVDECALSLKPAALDFEQAAAAPLVLITAWEALYDRARMESGHTILIHAGAGGVGHVAIQIAHETGARIATTVGNREKAGLVTELGADLPILYRETDFVEAVMQWTNNRGVDIAMDNVGGPLLQTTFPAVRFYGDVVSLLLPDKETDWSIARQRNLRTSLEVMLTPMLLGLKKATIHQAKILEACANLFDAGKLRIHISETLPLSSAARAHELIETGSTTGKIVLRISN